MADLDFTALRAEVEAATRLPEFVSVRKRARRARFRDRLATVGALLATLLVFTPVTVAAIQAGPAGERILDPPERPVDHSVVVTSPAHEEDRPISMTLRAAGGADFDNLYAAIDVCAGPSSERRCVLQVIQITSPHTAAKGPIYSGALRTKQTDSLSDVQLVPLSSKSLLLSGSTEGRPRSYLRVGVDGSASTPQSPKDKFPLSPGDRMVQLAEYGDVFAVRPNDELTLLPNTLPLTQVSAVTSIEPRYGWWITGTDPVTGKLSVSVSKDQGGTWKTSPLGVPAGIDVPTLATADGTTVYAFVRTMEGIRQVRSEDGGITWVEVPAKFPWPAAIKEPGALAGRGFGAIVRAGGSVLIWVDDDTSPVFVGSSDRGQTYQALTGPPGRVVPVTGGYAALSFPPALSRDAHTWADAGRPAIVPVN